MASVGYEYLRQALPLKAFPPQQPALVKPVTRVQPTPTYLAVPAHVAPASDQPLEHILFALKHEGVNLQILSQALVHVHPRELIGALRGSPNGRYLRMACHLWEAVTGQTLEDAPPPRGSYVKLFNPQKYVTGPSRRDPRWRINFNGLGSVGYCATVERSPTIEAAMQAGVLRRAGKLGTMLGPRILERALSWAYLHETRDSFAIERESPSEDKALTFVALLRQAHHRRPLSEDYLVELQSATVANPFDKAVSFRDEQNWLGGPGRGAAAVTYLPPPPEIVGDLMTRLMQFANTMTNAVDPLVAASVLSFGFVFIHPFMDGNGRLSRFLFHQALCQSGHLPDGLLLPVSIAMKKNEADYLRVLESYSRRAREFWRVTWMDAGNYRFDYLGDPTHAIYRYWDATASVEFGMAMAEQALDVELRQETRFLERYDAVRSVVEERFDVRGSDLSTLVVSCLDNHNQLSKRRRDQFGARVPEAVFALIEEMARRTERDAADEPGVDASRDRKDRA